MVDNAGTGSPKAYAIACGGRFEEVVDFGVGLIGGGEVALGPVGGANQVVAMNRGRNGRLCASGVHKLQQGHLSRGVLHGHAVGVETGIVFTALERRGW